MNFRDVELLSAYLDGRLGPSDAARLETRLSADPNLKATLEGLRETRGLLRRLPQRKAPRNFRLTPQMVGIRPPEPRAYPVFRLATALAGILFLTSVAVNALTPLATRSLTAAPAPMYGMGGGGGGAAPELSEVPSAATEAPSQAAFAALAPTATPEGTLAADAATNQALQNEESARGAVPAPTIQAKEGSPIRPGSPISTGQPIPVSLIIVLAVIMVLSGAAAWLLRLNTERRVRKRWNQK